MSGPIVRTGTTPAYWANFDRVFGNKAAKPATAKKAAAAKTPATPAPVENVAAKTPAKKSAKKAVKK